MSQYNAAPLFPAGNAARDATDLELIPFLPTMDQSGDWNPRARGQSLGSEASLPPQVGFVALRGETESTGRPAPKRSFGEPPLVAFSSQSARLPCATCLAAFPTNHQLEQHATKTKHKAYLCTCGCQKGFTKRSALRRHIQESAQAREHRCPLCDHKCKRVGHVEQHLRLVHNKSKDEIKHLLTIQKSEPRHKSEPASAASAAIPAPRCMVSQANYPAIVPAGPWNGPSGLYATARVKHAGSRPGHSPAFFPAPGTAHVTGSPAITPQNFMVQTPGFPGYPPYPAYPVFAMPAPTGFIANPVPGFSTYPAGPLDGTNNFFNVNSGPVSVGPSDGFVMPDVGVDFMMDFPDFDFNTFGN